jgi:hypothetical protein
MTTSDEKKLLLRQEIENNKQSFHSQLSDINTYYLYSFMLWQTHRNTNFVSGDRIPDGYVQSVMSGIMLDLTKKSPNDMIRLYLRPSVFKTYLSTYELFLSSLISLWLKAHPGILNDSSISFRDFYHASSRERVIDDVIERKIIDILYKNPRDAIKSIYEYLGKKNDGCSLVKDAIAKLAELKALRDVLEHNNSRINKVYLEKAGLHARGKDGETIEVTDDILEESFELLKQIIETISDDFCAKLVNDSKTTRY